MNSKNQIYEAVGFKSKLSFLLDSHGKSTLKQCQERNSGDDFVPSPSLHADERRKEKKKKKERKEREKKRQNRHHSTGRYLKT